MLAQPENLSSVLFRATGDGTASTAALASASARGPVRFAKPGGTLQATKARRSINWPVLSRRCRCAARPRSSAGSASWAAAVRTITCSALVLARVEVKRRAAVVRAEDAAVVPVGTGKEPPVATLTQQGIPNAADLCAIDAGAAVGRATHGVDLERHPMLLRLGRVFPAFGQKHGDPVGSQSQTPLSARCC